MLMITPSRVPVPKMRDFYDLLLGGTPLDRQRTQIVDNGDNVSIRMEVAGFSKENITIETKDEVMTVSGKITKESEGQGGSFCAAEEFSRSFNAEGINLDGITAKCENGVLTITCPKKTPPEAESKKIEIQ